MNQVEKVSDLIAQRRLMLFVGAGVSDGLGLPTWNGLIKKVASELGFDPDVFRRLGNNESLAEYYKIQKGAVGPLRSFMDTEWHAASIDIAASNVHRLIAELEFPLIYTTNYDRWIERALATHGKPYTRIANLADISNAQEGATHVVKFHGDFDDDGSLVLSESDYFERMEFRSALDLKFQADALRYSILFIGYGLNDTNIRILIYRLSKLWERETTGKRPPSYAFFNAANVVQQAVLGSRGIEVVSGESDDPGKSLEDFLVQVATRVKAAR